LLDAFFHYMQTALDRIISQGYVDVRIRIGGILQKHRLTVGKEKTAFGEMTRLVSKVDIPAGEMVRLANELQLPIKTPTGKVFPKGKGPADFTTP